MAEETPILKLPYPEPEDAADVPKDMKALAEATEDAITEAAVVPVGSVRATARTTAPVGFLLCDGSAVSRTTYKALFEAIGTNFGAGNGSTTFNLPDLRGRVPVGVDGTAGRLDANDALGNAAGEQKHTLTQAEIGSSPQKIIGPGVFVSTWEVQPSFSPHNNMQPYQVVNYIVKL
jgi:microcystin-dependent protein